MNYKSNNNVSYCFRKEMDMWPYFCHNPTSMLEGGLCFYITTWEIYVILHAYLADMLPLIVLVQKRKLSVSLFISENDFNQHSYVLTCVLCSSVLSTSTVNLKELPTWWSKKNIIGDTFNIRLDLYHAVFEYMHACACYDYRVHRHKFT